MKDESVEDVLARAHATAKKKLEYFSKFMECSSEKEWAEKHALDLLESKVNDDLEHFKYPSTFLLHYALRAARSFYESVSLIRGFVQFSLEQEGESTKKEIEETTEEAVRNALGSALIMLRREEDVEIYRDVLSNLITTTDLTEDILQKIIGKIPHKVRKEELN